LIRVEEWRMVDVAALPLLREACLEGWSRCVVLVGSGLVERARLALLAAGGCPTREPLVV
jgi:hypothetical protein